MLQSLSQTRWHSGLSRRLKLRLRLNGSHAINIRFQHPVQQPTTVFTDKGRGFYHTNGGRITDEYKQALAEHNLKAYYAQKSDQPGAMQDLMLHETVVAWVRNRETVTLPNEPWKETREDFACRLRVISQYINDHYDVEGVCRSLNERLEKLVANQGDRINK